MKARTVTITLNLPQPSREQAKDAARGIRELCQKIGAKPSKRHGGTAELRRLRDHGERPVATLPGMKAATLAPEPQAGSGHALAQQRIVTALRQAGKAGAAARLEAFYAKHPLRTPRKGAKGATELLREARDLGYRR